MGTYPFLPIPINNMICITNNIILYFNDYVNYNINRIINYLSFFFHIHHLIFAPMFTVEDSFNSYHIQNKKQKTT